MVVLPKWQAMWLESQHCSKGIANVPLSSIQCQKLLEDLKTNCCSSNKAVQLEALKCWGVWIKNQNPDDWKLNTVCFTAVRPLITKKLQPLQKDVDICKLRLSLMWALLIKVQKVIQLEGPQYILEVFLQSCLTWLNAINEDGCENEISVLIFQLLLAVFKKDESISGWDKEIIPPLSVDILRSKKVFHRLADKFLNVFIHWNKVKDKTLVLKLWKNFLELCEISREQIPIPVWHKIFKLAGEIFSEKSKPIKERLAFLHSCATVLKSVLTSSKFIDFGNLLSTPCEALLKKLVELCTAECDEFYDSEMFLHSKEICQVLSDKSITIGGYDLCISVLDVLDEFWLRSLFWGVWCGLVYCYKIRLSNQDKSLLTRTQIKFYRKLRGVVVNFELDRNYLHKDCISEVEKHFEVLNINCFCISRSIPDAKNTGDFIRSEMEMEVESGNENAQHLNSSSLVPITGSTSHKIVAASPRCIVKGHFTVSLHRGFRLEQKKTVNVNFDLIKDILKAVCVKSAQPIFNSLFDFRFFTLQPFESNSLVRSSDFSHALNDKLKIKEGSNLVVSCFERKLPPAVRAREKAVVLNDRSRVTDDVITTRRTRSTVKAEEEKKKEMEYKLRRKRRKSFEVIVQEIVRKNKERKTEKNSRRKSPIGMKKKVNQREKTENKTKPQNEKVSKRKLTRSKKEEPKSQKKKGKKAGGKLENYFKVISKKTESGVKNIEKKTAKGKKGKEKIMKSSCCQPGESEKKGETGWRQTSLKTMMSQKRKAEKMKEGGRVRNKTNVTNEKSKMKESSRAVNGSPLAKLSPFKEVFHDHEYAKLGFQKLETYEKILAKKGLLVTGVEKIDALKLTPVNLEREKLLGMKIITKMDDPECRQNETVDSEDCSSRLIKEVPVEPKPKNTNLNVPTLENVLKEKVDLTRQEKPEVKPKTELDSVVSDKSAVEPPLKESPKLCESNTPNDSANIKVEDIELTPSKRGKKRLRMMDSLKPSKKIKLEEETDDLLEVTEKENLEENQPEIMSPSKNGKNETSGLKNDGTPKTMNGIISSRALRMIALVPESTKGSQIQWESPHRAEVLKCKKAPNVDKNSRASKMLALLSENVVELDEVDDVKVEEVNSSSKLACTPVAKTPVSSLKSPKSVSKRRSIRFDETKNKTVLYETDTPPSKLLEEREKCRNTF